MSKKITDPKDTEMHSMADLLAEDDAFDADALLADLDKESNIRSYSGTVSKWILRGILIALIGFIFYCIYGYIEERARKSLFLGIILLAGYLLYPVSKKQEVHLKHIRWQDALCAVIAFIPYLYFALNVNVFIEKATKITNLDMIIALVGIVMLFELCRRVTGVPIMVVAGCFIVYIFYHCTAERGFDLLKTIRTIVYQLFYSNVSIMGSPISVCVGFIVLFILFGAFLDRKSTRLNSSH